MAKASRSKPASGRTKLPEFDPSELDDLIFTPAVGSGVGSHLLQQQTESTTVVVSDPEPDQSPVDTIDMTTVAPPDMTTEVASQQPLYIPASDNQAAVVTTDKPTVVAPEVSAIAEPPTVVEAPTVVSCDVPPVPRPAPLPVSLWLSESGEIVPSSRVKRIRLAQDVLSPAEESVYDTLWGVKSAGAFKEERESHRIVQAGYDFLMKRTRLSKKTIQRIVDRLIDKGFIAIEKPADIYLRSSTVYRVFAYRAVLERQAQKGRFHVAKIGPGFVYVREVADPRLMPPGPADMTTVVDSGPPTVGEAGPSTAIHSVAATDPADHLTTVVNAPTKDIDQQNRGIPSSSEHARRAGQGSGSAEPPRAIEASEARELRRLLEGYLGFIDDDATCQLLRLCRLRAADCTLEEIAYFVSHKMRSINGIHNPVGFILTAVPRHFENNAHASVRAFLAEERDRRRRVWQEEYRYWQSVAADREASPDERAQAEEVIQSLELSPDRPPDEFARVER